MMGTINLPYQDKSFTTIYADPPWPEVGGGRIVRGAQAHYELMKVSEIMAMGAEVKRVATDNAHLYLWTTNTYLPDALRIMESWGFQYKTKITWIKDRFGLGQYFRGMTEDCLFGVRGFVPYKTVEGKRAQGRTYIEAKRTEHSVKPQEMYDVVELVSTGPFLELFARNGREGWTSWGSEATQDFQLSLR